jgi:predicted ATPase/DNA-binding SARP family transcriptional activator
MVQIKQATTFTLNLLGEATLRSSGEPITFVADMRYQLLAYLALAGEWVSRDKLADLFWSDTTDVARKNLRQLLRRVQTFPWLENLEVERERIRWLILTDVALFQEAVQKGEVDEALTLYKGALLKGLDDYDDTGFASWLELERERLHSTLRELALERADKLVQTKQAAKAASLLRSLLEDDDLDEEVLALYLEAARSAGLKHQALRTYQDFRRRLRKELDLEPSTVTTQLAEMLEEEETTVRQPLPQKRSRLPDPLTSFIGRDAELANASRLIATSCLLTLTGPGGVGKTRLALEAAKTVADQFADGVSFVALAPLSNPDAIALNIAEALGLTLQGYKNPLSQVFEFIGNKKMLLVLDNFEHLLDGATLLSDMLRACPHLRLLVTSRERLNLSAEWTLSVGGLAFPTKPVSLTEASSYDAVSLFVERARRVQPSFELTDEELPFVLKICGLVQGLPLGLELAAVWVRMMSCEEIASEIAASLDFLSSAARNVDERHSSLRTTLEYSWKLLTEQEQDVLKKLSVFQGGISREAATIVANANGALLAALVDKSLLYIVAKSRYDLHPLVAQFAREKLSEDQAQETQTNTNHAAFFSAMVEPAERELRGAGQDVWLKRLELEHDNFRTALRWTKMNNETAKHLQLLQGMWRFWWLHGYLSEGRKWMTEGLFHYDSSQSSNALLRGRVLLGAGILAWAQGNFTEARDHLEEGLQLARSAEDTSTLAPLLSTLATVAQEQGDDAAARSFAEEGLLLERTLEDKQNLSGLLIGLGRIAWGQGRLAEAKTFLEESVALERDLADKASAAIALNLLGLVACDQGEYAEARTLMRESLTLRWELESRWGLASSLAQLACLAVAQGHMGRAAVLWGAAEKLREELGAKVVGTFLARYESDVATTHQQLGEQAFKIAWARGREMSLADVVTYALKDS